jgi:hypothetical protein
MASTIDTAFVNSYHGLLEHQFQQKGSRLRGTVRNVTQNSEYDYWDRVGTSTAHEMTTRHADTTYDDENLTRRRNQVTGYNTAKLFDNQDKLRMIIDPTSGFAESQAMALGRKMDSIVISAASGTAYSGKTGATSVAYDTDFRIAVDYVESGAATNSNLTIGKLRRARYLLDSEEAVMDGEAVHCIVSASQIQSLLRHTEVQSADYNTVKALVQGEIDTFMGFKFIRTQLLSKSGNNRTCLIYPPSAILLGVASDISTRINELPTKQYSVQVYSEATFGATRLWEEKVIEILCDETK